MDCLREEADAVLRDVQFGVKHAQVSNLSSQFETMGVIFEITTLEGDFLLVLMNQSGFQTTTKEKLTLNDLEGQWYETIEALMMEKSSEYRNSFHATLWTKLSSLGTGNTHI